MTVTWGQWHTSKYGAYQPRPKHATVQAGRHVLDNVCFEMSVFLLLESAPEGLANDCSCSASR
jgi:hypothetical protein